MDTPIELTRHAFGIEAKGVKVATLKRRREAETEEGLMKKIRIKHLDFQ